MSEEETLVPLDESDILAHCERQDQKIRELETALAEKEGQITALTDNLRLFNPCGHSNVESAVCGICGYPDPRKAIASLKEDFEAMARTAGLQAEEIVVLNSDIRGWMVKGLALGEEREKLKQQIATSKALEAKFFPQKDAYRIVEKLRKAGFGEPEHPHGNTLLGMTENCLEQIAALNPCGHTGFESDVCTICGYPDPRKLIAELTAYKENNYDPTESIRLTAEIMKQKVQISVLTAENEKLRVRLRTHGDIETDKEEALRGQAEN